MSLQVDRTTQTVDVRTTYVYKRLHPCAAADVTKAKNPEAYLIDTLVICCVHGALSFGDCSPDLSHKPVLLVQGILPLSTQDTLDEAMPSNTARDFYTYCFGHSARIN